MGLGIMGLATSGKCEGETESYGKRGGSQRGGTLGNTGNSAGVFPGPSPQLTKSQLYLWLNLWGLGPNDVLIRKMRGKKRKKQESYTKEDFTGGAAVKNLLANAGDAGALGSIPGLGRSPGGGNGNPL